jgi:hypothetical protein
MKYSVCSDRKVCDQLFSELLDQNINDAHSIETM